MQEIILDVSESNPTDVISLVSNPTDVIKTAANPTDDVIESDSSNESHEEPIITQSLIRHPAHEEQTIGMTGPQIPSFDPSTDVNSEVRFFPLQTSSMLQQNNQIQAPGVTPTYTRTPTYTTQVISIPSPYLTYSPYWPSYFLNNNEFYRSPHSVQNYYKPYPHLYAYNPWNLPSFGYSQYYLGNY